MRSLKSKRSLFIRLNAITPVDFTATARLSLDVITPFMI